MYIYYYVPGNPNHHNWTLKLSRRYSMKRETALNGIEVTTSKRLMIVHITQIEYVKSIEDSM